MTTQTKLIFTITALIYLVLLASLSSALTVTSVSADTLTPGSHGTITIELENNLDDTADSVSLKLDFTNLPLTPIGNSEDSIDELDDGDDEEFSFRIKAANNVVPGDYKIPYSISYLVENQTRQNSGFIGITVEGSALLSFSIETEKPVIGMQDQLTLKIVNKGFADARFVSVKINSEGFNVLSDKEVYIGTVDSDDFETATFDVIYTSQKPIFSAEIQYKDFNNRDMIKTISLPVTVYSQEKAIELGIIQKSNAALYIIIIVTIILIIVLYRLIRRRMRKSRQRREQSS